jgi:hypothetical protein
VVLGAGRHLAVWRTQELRCCLCPELAWLCERTTYDISNPFQTFVALTHNGQEEITPYRTLGRSYGLVVPTMPHTQRQNFYFSFQIHCAVMWLHLLIKLQWNQVFSVLFGHSSLNFALHSFFLDQHFPVSLSCDGSALPVCVGSLHYCTAHCNTCHKWWLNHSCHTANSCSVHVHLSRCSHISDCLYWEVLCIENHRCHNSVDFVCIQNAQVCSLGDPASMCIVP